MKSSTRAAGVTVLAVCLLGLPGFLSPVSAAEDATAEHNHEHTHDHSHEHGSDAESDHAPSQPTMNRWSLLGLYSLIIAAASLFGGWLPAHVKLSHLQFQLVMSAIGGLILGIGVLHLLPHAVHEIGRDGVDTIAKWMLAGMVMMFFLLRAFHVHHHQPEINADAEDEARNPPVDLAVIGHAEPVHLHGPNCDHSHTPESRLSWLGIFFGLAVHTLLDGLALGATMQAEATHSAATFVGVGILMAIALHKPLDSLSITTLMMNAGKSSTARWAVNLVYALLCPIGAAAFMLGVGRMDLGGHFVVGCALAFSAGVFICISLADLLPEMEFHSHHRVRLSIALLLGIALAWGIGFLEPAHLHH
ncbi:zinc transporter ZupT [Thalassoglobus neptunius]|uniref:Zinc transporter ZupT n=1 Tax=Thalassoglobus neptunius TaxID=1938619 RepID=A0A5C5X7H7_9PLAN|nr:ZIP family metal transporter [Thalassoglobus neptunius]TWT58864.1 zinc transporter ZupT [Thalassoglobus neptunius]